MTRGIIHTEKGDMTVELYDNETPITANWPSRAFTTG